MSATLTRYPIYHIPYQRNVKDLSACFLTYHTISSSFQGMFYCIWEINLYHFDQFSWHGDFIISICFYTNASWTLRLMTFIININNLHTFGPLVYFRYCLGCSVGIWFKLYTWVVPGTGRACPHDIVAALLSFPNALFLSNLYASNFCSILSLHSFTRRTLLLNWCKSYHFLNDFFQITWYALKKSLSFTRTECV
jgi:hypothetical protein